MPDVSGESPGAVRVRDDETRIAPAQRGAARRGAAPQDAARHAVERARAALGFEREDELVVTRLALDLEVGRHGVERTLTQRSTWRALRDGVSALPVILVVPTPVTRRVVIEPLRGCRLGPDYADLADGVFATALRLERTLTTGESVVTEHRTHLPDDPHPRMHCEHRVLQRVEQVDVTVRFHPDLRPRECAFFTRTEGVETPTPLTSHDGVCTGSARDFGPGAVGFRWQW